MAERIVFNTSPLLALGQMQALDVVRQLPFEFVCPPQVEAEIRAGAAQGYPVDVPAWLMVLPLNTPPSPLAVAALDDGEAAVIQLALEQNISRVCIDELKGRRAALAVGLQVVGSLGLLGRAKTLGLLAAVRPLIERAQQTGIYYDAKLINSFLAALGE